VLDPILLISKLTLVQGGRSQALDILRRVVQLDRTEPGTIVQAVQADVEDEDILWLYELWESQAALDEHRTNGAELRQSLSPLIASIDRHRCTPLFAKGVDFERFSPKRLSRPSRDS
jgi:quinol monooxygenase YgiN